MRKVFLGNTGIEISPVGLGCMGFTHAYGDPIPEKEAADKIRKAYDIGYTFFDTAQRYTGIWPDGTIAYNETVVGEALKEIRDQVVIATKCGISMVNGMRTLDSRPETIKNSLDDSLLRLQTDYVDLYYLHSMDEHTDIEQVAYTMKELYEQGKIRAWGISQCDEKALRKAHAVFPVSAVQLRYSMMARWEERIFPACKELGITFVAFSPMANGFLTGKYDGRTVNGSTSKADFRTMMPQFTEEGYQANKELLNYLGELANEKQATMAQISLAWMENKDIDIVPIPGSTKLERLEENFNSSRIIMTTEEVQSIDQILDRIANGPVFGKR
ncbi:MAG: aldo/keto reductase [Firmicutes bacterium]|nr:aldo/keto reductase [Bacillota bacterium]